MAEHSHIPKMHAINNDYEKLVEENKKLAENKPKDNNKSGFMNEAMLREQLGDRYDELGEMVN